MAGSTRRGFLGTTLAFGLGLGVGGRVGAPAAFAPGPPAPLDDDERELADKMLGSLDRAKIWDAHVHIVGLGSGGTGCWVNPAARSHARPLRRFRYEVYVRAAGVTDESRADQQYVERLLSLQRVANPTGKLLCLAFDYAVRQDGSEDRGRSEFYTPDEYVLGLAREHPELVACASVHPYRKDALDRLDRAVQAGAVAVKWLPNAMGIDPLSERCDAFYERLSELDVPLITHAGDEQAVHVDAWQELGNPLRLRRALDAGVRVVVAHCAGKGDVQDIDAGDLRRIPAFDAFMRLFNEERYKSSLFGDLSALTQVSRAGKPLRELLISKHLGARLLYGSDYPLPAIDPLVSTRLLAQDGYIDDDQREQLNRIYLKNPLLFDLLLKRMLRVSYKNATYGFADAAFQTADFFEQRRPLPT
ncbi:MAG: amidohydrolase family protein [Polyangiaceae bacterium]|nr:amidohydrolase family protein [Polyangiaceae bacterium]